MNIKANELQITVQNASGKVCTTTTTTTTTTSSSPLRSVWNIGPQQLSSSEAVDEVSVAFKFFYRDRVARPVLQLPAMSPGTEYPF
jgi:hypothetical protein